MKTYFTSVVYSGSTCMCGALRHTTDECGHQHRTEAGAKKCLHQLQRWSDDGRSCSATWFGGSVTERDRATDSDVVRVPVFDIDMYYSHDDITTSEQRCRC